MLKDKGKTSKNARREQKQVSEAIQTTPQDDFTSPTKEKIKMVIILLP
jgi:hypothetical protein